MKKTIIIVLCVLAFTACKKEKGILEKIKDASEEITNTAKDLGNVKSVVSGMDEAKELTSKLKAMQPIDKEGWKSWMPKKLNDLERTSFRISSGGLGNLNTLKLQFKTTGDITKQFKIDITDGADSGSGIAYMYKMEASMSLDTENEKGYEKIHKRDGVVIKEKYTKGSFGTHTKMKFLIEDRFAVIANANNIEPDELWKTIQELNFNNLK